MAGFTYKLSNGVGYYSIDDFDNTSLVKTCFSSRIGGISKYPFDTLNLGYKSGDLEENVSKNFEILCSVAGFKLEDMVLSDQVHGDKCKVVEIDDRGKGVLFKSDIIGVDALITDKKDIALCIFTADCVPVFLMDKRKRVIALCHAGWRGIVNEIVPKTIRKMILTYGTNPGDIIAAIGPSIGPCCFNVGSDVAEKFKILFGNDENIIINSEGDYKINLWEAAISQLLSCGLCRDDIISSNICTSCSKDKLYSYRREGSKTGRMISIIQLI